MNHFEIGRQRAMNYVKHIGESGEDTFKELFGKSARKSPLQEGLQAAYDKKPRETNPYYGNDRDAWFRGYDQIKS